MVKETIDSIRQAEQAAEQRETDAGREAEQIITAAEAQAASLKSDLTRQAREKAAQTEAAAKARADQIMEEAGQAQDQELEALRSAVTGKSDQAVKAVLAGLL